MLVACVRKLLALRIIHPRVAVDPKLITVYWLLRVAPGLPLWLRLHCHGTAGCERGRGRPARGYATGKDADYLQHSTLITCVPINSQSLNLAT